MSYSAFQALEAYLAKHSGAAIEVLLVNENDPSDKVIGAATSVDLGDDFEQIPIEEAGNDGIDEIVTGRHSANGSIGAFWTPEWNDAVPTRQSFIGKSYLLIERIGPGRPGAGTVVNAATGVKISNVRQNHGARGAKNFNLTFTHERRYNGKEWAAFAAGS